MRGFLVLISLLRSKASHLLKRGIFSYQMIYVRAPPFLKGDIDEQDAIIDTLSMISLIHRKLDKAEEARKMYEGNF